MNIFALSNDPEEAVRWHFDTHVVKMPLESAQMLSTARHVLGSENPVSYRPTHENHPCSLWARKSLSNYEWLVNYGFALCKEFRLRYGKDHGCLRIIRECSEDIPLFSSTEATPFALAMPDEFKTDCPHQSYKNYYQSKKQSLHKWRCREVPEWFSSLKEVEA